MTEAALGNMPPSLIALFMFYSLPQFFTYVFPLTLYISIIITLGRICSDSEMVVMKAVGFSHFRISIVVFILGLISAFIVGYVSIVLAPRMAEASYTLEKQAANDPEFLPIESGRFVSYGFYNIYVENVADKSQDEKDIRNIYVIDRKDYETNAITAAKSGHMSVDEDGVRWIELQNGTHYEYHQDGTMRRADFETFRAPVSANITEETRQKRDISMMSTLDLINSDSAYERLEAQRRISPILTTLVLCIIAVPLSMVNPRQGRFNRLMPSILIYLAYYLCLMSMFNFVKTGAMPLYPGLYIVPLFFLIAVAAPLNMPKTYLKHISKKRARALAASVSSTVDAISSDKSSSVNKQDSDDDKHRPSQD